MGEKELIQRIRDREEQGAEDLLRHYGPLMRYIIEPILASPQDREECLSEAAMRVWDGIGGYDPDRGSWTAWLTAVTRNTALNRLRKSCRGTEALSEHTPAPEPPPEEALLERERREELRQAIARLPEKDLRLFYRKYYYMQSTEQIAAELGLTPRAVEGRLYRIRERLRKQLGGDGHGRT
ncbi:RNA polymerase sigma factor [uncultured Pseudoflavonifractor sp.]|uniref:RNA polymerase sigma factor n=1 Tax=uncultured Pseudoflavonifractor sp. TaxID=1221379 RepID=UPI0025FD2782|nr:sigma-70 family RNA polymerase sigma factor [uncultured Pseudoflavonifractor sp.]